MHEDFNRDKTHPLKKILQGTRSFLNCGQLTACVIALVVVLFTATVASRADLAEKVAESVVVATLGVRRTRLVEYFLRHCNKIHKM